MPIRKKKDSISKKKFIIWAIVIVLVVLMIVSFAPVQHTTEIVLFS